MADSLATHFANPSSTHTAGRISAKLLASARLNITNALGGGGNVYFTSGGTESNNWAIQAAIHKNRHKGKHIITTAIEHDSVLTPLKQLESEGYRVTVLSPDTKGHITTKQLKDALCEDTVLVAIMLVNNETGGILPIADMVKLVKAHSSALFFTDAVQAFCKIPCSPLALGVDFLSVSAHKIHGPKGSGALWVKDDLHICPMLLGGGQEQGLRSGTESLHNIMGFSTAVTLALENFDANTKHLYALQAYLRTKLAEVMPHVLCLPMGAPHIFSLSLPGYKSEVLMNFLDAKDILLSHASACKRGGRSHVLSAMGLSPKVIDGTLRVSFSYETTQADLDTFVAALSSAEQSLFPSL